MNILLLTVMILRLSIAQGLPLQNVAEIVGKVQSNVQASRSSRGELDCKEKRTFLSSTNGATSLIWSAETDIVRTPEGRPFRRVLSVQGRAPESWLQKGDSPFGNEELFGTAEHIFTTPNRDSRTFKAAASETLNGRAALVVEFEGHPPNFIREFGKAWIDKDSFRVMRIEVHSINERFDPFTTEEYAGVNIDGKQFWLSTKRTIETRSTPTAPEGRKTIEITELSDCRRFEVSVKVRPAQ
jgi:hypothetical protein